MIDWATFAYVVMAFLVMCKLHEKVMAKLHRLVHEIPLSTNNTLWTIVDSMLESYLRRDSKSRRFQRLPGRCRAKRRKMRV